MSALSLNELDADLDDFIVGDLAYHEDTEPPQVLDVDQADRLLRRIARLEQDHDRLSKLAQARKAQIDEWFAERAGVIERERDWFLRSAEAWMRAQHADGGPQTHKLPSGTLQLRKAPAKLDATGDTVPDRFARKSWDKTAVKAATEPGPELEDQSAAFDDYVAHAAVDKQTGEIVDGVVYLLRRRHSFSHRTGGAL